MSILLDTSIDFERFGFEDDYISELPIWVGREVRVEDLGELQSYFVRKIFQVIKDDEALIYKLACLGTFPEKRSLIAKDIQKYGSQDQWEVTQAGLRKTWKSTCKATKEFLETYQDEILLGAVVVATIAGIVVVSGCTNGAGTQIATAAGGALINSFIDSCYGTTTVNQIPLGFIPLPSPANKQSYYAPIENDTPLYLGELSSPTDIHSLLSQKLYPELHPIYDEKDIQRLYAQFGLNYTPPGELPVERVEPAQKTKEPSSLLTFRELIEQKLTEAQSPKYVEQFPEWPKSNLEFVKYLEENYLVQIKDRQYFPTLEMLKGMFPQKQGVFETYGSELASKKPKAPFLDMPFLGCTDQGTVHFHSGIRNTFTTVVEAGLSLNNSLERTYAIQPHLLHTNGFITGLTMVGLEQLDKGLGQYLLGAGLAELPGVLLQHSMIERSVNYVVESLSQIAQNILNKENPLLKQVHVTFSNGGYVMNEALKRLPQEYKDTIIVITTGTTAIIEEGQACKVVNFIGDKDWPSQLCNGGLKGIEKAKEKAEVRLISQLETKVLVSGHYCDQLDYHDAIKRYIQDNIGMHYEIY